MSNSIVPLAKSQLDLATMHQPMLLSASVSATSLARNLGTDQKANKYKVSKNMSYVQKHGLRSVFSVSTTPTQQSLAQGKYSSITQQSVQQDKINVVTQFTVGESADKHEEPRTTLGEASNFSPVQQQKQDKGGHRRLVSAATTVTQTQNNTPNIHEHQSHTEAASINDELAFVPSIKKRKIPQQSVKQMLERARSGVTMGELDAEDQQQEAKQRQLAEEYSRFKRKIAVQVYDKDGQLLYGQSSDTKMAPFDYLQKKIYDIQQREIERSRQMRKAMFSAANLKKEVQRAETVKDIGGPQDESVQKSNVKIFQGFIEKGRNKTLAALDNMFKLNDKQRIIARSREDVQTFYNEAQSVLRVYENAQREGTREQEIGKIELMDLQVTVEELQNKCRFLQEQLDESNARNEKLLKLFNTLNEYKSSYDLMTAQYPNTNLIKIIERYEFMAEQCAQQFKKTVELEEDARAQRDINLKEVDSILERNKELGDRIMRLTEEKKAIEKEYRDHLLANDNKYYQEQYFKMFNRTVELFVEWKRHLNVYELTGEFKVDLKDPLEILDTLLKMVRISTTEKAQAYLRKIISSANVMCRKLFPDQEVQKFDPEMIYERVLRLVSDLQAKYTDVSSKYKALTDNAK